MEYKISEIWKLNCASCKGLSVPIRCDWVANPANWNPLHSFLSRFDMCCSTHDSKGIAKLFVRIGFGLALAFAGLAHYQDPTYAESVGRGLGVLEPLGMVWGYVLPGLMIIGGLLLAFGIYMHIAAYLSSIALASIPAGLMLKSAISGISLNDTMPPAMNALVWILVLMVAVKGGCGTGCGTGCGCGMDGCACPPNAVPPKVVAPVKSMPVAPVASVKAPAVKKAPAKKPVAKKPTVK